jgi:hypothetical protein
MTGKASPARALVAVVLASLLMTMFAEATFAAATPSNSISSSAPTKQQVISRLKDLQERQGLALDALEDAVKKRLKESTSVTLKSQDLAQTKKRISSLSETIADIDQHRGELLARRQFVDQLIFLIDSKWNGQNLQSFLEHQVLDMATNDLGAGEVDGKIWKFLTYLSIAVREVPEPREDVMSIVESYMNFASVLNPRSPADFMASRHYTNGSISVTARPASRDTLGDDVESRLRGSTSSTTVKASKPDLELRMKIMPSPPAQESTEPEVIEIPAAPGQPSAKNDQN